MGDAIQLSKDIFTFNIFQPLYPDTLAPYPEILENLFS